MLYDAAYFFTVMGFLFVYTPFIKMFYYSVLAHGRWLSPGTPASSTTKTGRHDIDEILQKVALSTINQIKSSSSIACGLDI